MRTFPVARVLARGCLSTTVLIGTAAFCQATASEAASIPLPSRPSAVTLPATQAGSFQELRATLSENDRAVALRALHVALNQVSDGAAFVWRSRARKLTGVIRPTMAFRDDDGRICRHLVYTVALGPYKKHVEGIACRGISGRWLLGN